MSGSANATMVQRDEEGGEDQMTAVGVGVGEHIVVDVNPHLHSRSVTEDKKTSPASRRMERGGLSRSKRVTGMR